MATTIHIDGAYGEGGGQVIRTSLSLAAITGQAVEIVNIRARRAKPGLQPQHLMAVQAAAAICAADVAGAAVGSMYIRFAPTAKPCPGDYRFEIGTAGATPLVLQTVLLPLTLADGPSRVTVTGGTHVPHAPTADYLATVYLPALQRAGYQVRFSSPRAGFYPRGGGEISAEIAPVRSPSPFDFVERGALQNLQATVLTSSLPAHVGERGQATVEQFMRGIGRRIRVERVDRPSFGAGAAVTIAAECTNGFAGFTSLGERGKPMEKVSEEACKDFLAWWKTAAACDEHLADQLVLPAALAHGESRWTTPVITEHLRTVIWVTQHFLPVEAMFTETPGEPVRVALRGQAV